MEARRVSKSFYVSFIAALFLFIAINLIAAHLQSDCGIRAVIGIFVSRFSGCMDDVVRIGFPFLFMRVGGFAAPFFFSVGALIGDIVVAGGASVLVGLIAQRVVK
jgi:hypothetical protein